MTFISMECWETEVAVSGTIDLPTNMAFTDSAPDENQEYDVLTIQGTGSVDDGSKTYNSFDYTVVAGPCLVRLYPRKPGAIRQVA